MEQKNQRNPRRRLNSLILLVAFTAVMLIVSTYAWFSAQKNVTLSNLTGTVKVVEGLEISLDANTWSQEVDFSKYTPTQLANLVYAVTTETTDDENHNIVPSEMLPVSTTGTESVGDAEITMLRGENLNSIQLKDVVATQVTYDNDGDTATAEVATTAAANPTIYPGYYAIDFFLKNTSADGTTTNVLQLNGNSSVNVLSSGGDASTGIQNTPRVAFALYQSTDGSGSTTNENSVVDTMAKYDEIVTKTMKEAVIEDVAIWEPNADKHVDYIVTNNNNITWKDADKTGYLSAVDGEGALTGKYLGTEKIPTYALLESSITSSATNRFTDIYNWSGAATGKTYLDENGATLTENGYSNVQKQIALQTSQVEGTGKVTENYYNLISAMQTDVTDYEKAFYNNSPSTIELNKFEIPANEICRIRMYVWLEGQDVDCINYASHGGGIEIDVGLIKDAGNS